MSVTESSPTTTMEQKKILFVITKSNWGGAQRYVYNLATSLPRAEFDVQVTAGGVGGFKEAPGLLAEKLIHADIPFTLVRNFMRNVWIMPDVLAFFELILIFKRKRPDVVHLNSSKAGALGALAGRIAGVKKIVFTSHGLLYDEDRSRLAKAILLAGSWLTFFLCTDVILISKNNYTRARHLPLVGKKMHLIPNGLPELSFLSKQEARAELSKKIPSLNDGRPLIGVIAELTPNKDLPSLILAAAQIEGTFAVGIIGDGSDRQKLEEQIRNGRCEEKVFLLGFMKDAYRLLRGFDLFTLPSRKEGLPYVLLEAGQAALPVVATDIPGVGDIIADEKTGLLVPARNPGALAHALSSLLRDPARAGHLGESLKAHVSQEFSLEQMVEKTSLLYRS